MEGRKWWHGGLDKEEELSGKREGGGRKAAGKQQQQPGRAIERAWRERWEGTGNTVAWRRRRN